MYKSLNEHSGRCRSSSAAGEKTEHSVEAYIIRSKKAAGYLRQILHSQRCLGKCQVLGCVQTTRILQHVPLCDAVALCRVPGCDTTKKLLLHFEQCRSRTPLKANGVPSSTCLICSIACSSSPTKQLSAAYNRPVVLSRRAADEESLSDQSMMVAEQPEESLLLQQQQGLGDLEEEDSDDEKEDSFASDEIIEFNRIPFQSLGRSSQQQQSARKKTYSDSEFAVPVGVPGRGGIVKVRSKSMNAMSVDELASSV